MDHSLFVGFQNLRELSVRFLSHRLLQRLVLPLKSTLEVEELIDEFLSNLFDLIFFDCVELRWVAQLVSLVENPSAQLFS